MRGQRGLYFHATEVYGASRSRMQPGLDAEQVETDWRQEMAVWSTRPRPRATTHGGGV